MAVFGISAGLGAGYYNEYQAAVSESEISRLRELLKTHETINVISGIVGGIGLAGGLVFVLSPEEEKPPP